MEGLPEHVKVVLAAEEIVTDLNATVDAVRAAVATVDALGDPALSSQIRQSCEMRANIAEEGREFPAQGKLRTWLQES